MAVMFGRAGLAHVFGCMSYSYLMVPAAESKSMCIECGTSETPFLGSTPFFLQVEHFTFVPADLISSVILGIDDSAILDTSKRSCFTIPHYQ